MATFQSVVCYILVTWYLHFASAETRSFKRVCYLTGWALKRKDRDARIQVEDVDPFLCTHIIYAFAKVDTTEAEIKAVEWDDESSKTVKGVYERLTDLKAKNPQLKILLSIGGANAGSYTFDLIVNNPETQWAFIENAIKYLRKWRFDGLDLDWEYPGLPEKGTTEETKYLFTEFLKELYNAFVDEARRAGRRRLLLSAAVGAGEKHVKDAYEVEKIVEYVDWLSVMAYDYHGGWDRFLGGNSPLVGRSDDTRFDQRLSVEWTINQYIKAGAPRSKLLLGIPAQGRSFTVKNETEIEVGSAGTGHGVAGPYLGIKGILAYFEVCLFVRRGATRKWDSTQYFPFAYKDDQWVGYDSPRSVALKAEWLVSMRLGGAMLWALDLDDFNGKFCHDGKFPIARTIKSVLNDRYVRIRPTRASLNSSATNIYSFILIITLILSKVVHSIY